MTLPLVKMKLQTFGTNLMPTTEVRLIGLGMALVGVVRENFLTQAHNKAHYIEGRAQSEAPSLALLQSKVDHEARFFLLTSYFLPLTSYLLLLTRLTMKRGSSFLLPSRFLLPPSSSLLVTRYVLLGRP